MIDTATNTVTTTIPVGNHPVEVMFSPDGSRAYVTNLFGNSVSVINTSTNTVDSVPVGRMPVGLAVAPDGTRAYVTSLPAAPSRPPRRRGHPAAFPQDDVRIVKDQPCHSLLQFGLMTGQR